MNGWDEAAAWLAENAPDWRIAYGRVEMVAGTEVGAPTTTRATVTLVRNEPLRDSPTVESYGSNYLSATMRAIGYVAKAGAL